MDQVSYMFMSMKFAIHVMSMKTSNEVVLCVLVNGDEGFGDDNFACLLLRNGSPI